MTTEHELRWRRQVACDDESKGNGDNVASNHIELSPSGDHNNGPGNWGRAGRSGAGASGEGEPEKLREWLARELKIRVAGGGDGGSGTTSGGCAEGAGEDNLRTRPELERLVRGQATSWEDSRHVIVDIDNRKQIVANRRVSSEKATTLPASQREVDQFAERPEDSASNRVAREPAKLAVGSKQSETVNRQHHQQQQSQLNQRQQVAGEISGRGQQADTSNDNKKPEEGQQEAKSTRKLPTFGGIPRKFSRLPYFSYYGKTRNVELDNSTNSPTTKPLLTTTPASPTSNNNNNSNNNSNSTKKTQALNVQVASSQSGGSLEDSPTSGGSKIPTLTKRSAASLNNQYSPQSNNQLAIEDDDLDQQQQQQRASRSTRGVNWRGYSNISNLFPVERPLRLTGGQSRRVQSSSLSNLNLSSQRVGGGFVGQQRSALGQQSQFGRRNSLSNQTTQQRQSQPQRIRSSVSQLHSPVGRISANDLLTTNTATMRRQNVGKPPAAATGGYKQQMGRALGAAGSFTRGRPQSSIGAGGAVAGGGGYHLTKNHRSPSASSLHYSSGIGLSPYGPPILDPDCPVHGDYPTPGAPARNQRGATLSKSSQNLQNPAIGGADLLYADGMAAADYPNYYDTRPPLRNRASSLYSPQSPQSPPFGSYRSIAGQQDRGVGAKYGSGNAYYNSASRFSLYHPSETGLRSHLAPTNEQLRRILGYQPPTKPVHLHPQWAYSRPFIHLQGGRSPSPQIIDGELGAGDELFGPPPVRYEVYNQLQDAQAIRAVDFHPSGEVYAIGSNSRALRICAYPADHELRHFALDQHEVNSPRVLFKFLQVHRGSIYCVGFNGNGQLLATGSNDQTVHIVKYNSTTHSPDGDEFRLTMHDGTVRDLCFIDDSASGSSLLLSAGGGDNRIYVTDCDTITPFQSMAGHTQMVMSLSHLAGATFVSASYDKTIRFWDLRTRGCTSIVSAPPNYGTAGNWVGPGAPVCAVKVEPSGRLLASGHSDSTCMLYDIRGSRIIQTFRPHDDEIRTINFSPKSYYLLTGGYDGRVVLSDLQGDLTQPLPSVCVAESDDKIVQAKWHPSDFTFVTTSADKSATLWALPTE